MQCRTQRRVVEGQVAGQRVDSQGRPTCHLRDGMLHFVDQRQHIVIITRVPYRKMGGKDETRGGLGNNAGFAAKLGRTIALAFANRRNSAIVGIDDFTRGQRFALGEAPRRVPVGCGYIYRAGLAPLTMGFQASTASYSAWDDPHDAWNPGLSLGAT